MTNKLNYIEDNAKIGVIITTNGNYGIFAKQCIECYLRELPKNSLIILYINESNDEITLNLKNEFKQIKIIYIEDQTKNGGLTGTWNQGIHLCLEEKCEVIILSNDDILFDNSIKNIINEAYINRNKLEYYGPLTNNPGPADCNKIQYGRNIRDSNAFVLEYKNRLHNINGFFMVFSRKVLKENQFDEKHYFNPKYPFNYNEIDWFERFIKKGGRPIVVPKTFIYHYKIARWRNKVKNNVCIYTINTGR